MLKAVFKPFQLIFNTPVLTSRGAMNRKSGYLVYITDGTNTGVGECSIIEGLSRDRLSDLEEVLSRLCENPELWDDVAEKIYDSHPSICFAFETALLDLQNGGRRILFESDFTKGLKCIPINGLIWMGESNFMREQINTKKQHGFKCLKLKVGAIDFEEECKILEQIRKEFSSENIEIRLDANGAFTKDDVFKKLEQLSEFDIHSIEQPVKPRQQKLMSEICDAGIIDIALDEELIADFSTTAMEQMLAEIKPQYIILKPSLLGGFKKSEEWISAAKRCGIEWWATSALESNVGLNAIAQWVFRINTGMFQGLGTGSLYLNNFSSPLEVRDGNLCYNPEIKWQKL